MHNDLFPLNQPAQCAGWTILHFQHIDSTNTELKRRAAAGHAAELAIIADCQTGGRGRRGRSFLSPAGKGLYLSVTLMPTCPPDSISQLTAWAAVALCRAVEQVCGVRPGIKWPNDLVLNGKKLCGILTETMRDANGHLCVILGIGVNLTQDDADFGPEVAPTAISLQQALGCAPQRDVLAVQILQELALLRRDFPCRRDTWLLQFRQNCLTLGKPVRVLWPSQIRKGTAVDVTDTFGLLVCWEDGTESTVTSGEVSVRGLYGYT